MRLLAALCSLTLLAATADAQDDPDVEVYVPVASQVPLPKGVVTFDADWTADRKIALAYVEDHGSAHRLVLATYDPASQAFERLADIMAKPWRIPEVSLAVPETWYGDPKLDRIFVAASIQATPQGWPSMVTNGVRLFSVPIEPGGKLTVASPPNKPGMATSTAAEPPHAQVSLLPWKGDYVVDVVFIDPDSQILVPEPVLGCDGQVMVSRSFDHGNSLGDAFFVTGAFAANCSELSKSMAFSRFGSLATAADDSNGRTLIAVEDLENDVLHVLHGAPDEKQVEWFTSTASTTSKQLFAPRLACAEGRFTLTGLSGLKGSTKGNELEWFNGELAIKGFTQFSTLHSTATTPGDVDVRGSKAWIVAGCRPDGGGGAPVATVFEGSRNDPWLYLPAVEVPDDGLSTGLPRVGVSPEGTPKMGSYFFHRPADAVAPEGVRMDP